MSYRWLPLFTVTFALSNLFCFATDVKLEWDPSPSANIAAYTIYYGPQSRSYTNWVRVGNVTNGIVTGLVPGATYWFAATASDDFDLESDYSEEISYLVQDGLTLPTISITAPDAVAGEPASGEGTATFVLTRTGSTSAPLTVNVSSGGTATSGNDYVPMPGTITFQTGSSTASLLLKVVDDTEWELDETVDLALLPGQGYSVGSPVSATAILKDDEGLAVVVLPTISITASDAVAGEPASSEGTATFVLTRTGSTAAPLTVNLSSGGTAASGTDYVPMPGTITFPTGSSTVSLLLTVLDDTEWEQDETLDLAVLPGQGYSVGSPASATAIIKDDEGLAVVVLPTISITAPDAVAGEPASGQGTGTFVLSRTGSTAASLTVNLSSGGTAASGTDYVSMPGTITFPTGSSTVSLLLTVLDDTEWEQDETLDLAVLPGQGYSVGSPASATAIIKDDEGLSVVVQNTEVILDNAASTGVSFAGSWGTSTAATAYWDSNFQQTISGSKGAKSATFTPNLPTAGAYEISIWYPGGLKNAGTVPVDIVYAGGTTTLSVDQRINGGQWNSLGTFNFDAGSLGSVCLRSKGKQYVVADAIKWKKVVVAAAAAALPLPDAPPVLSIRPGTPGTVLLEWFAELGVAYVLESSTDGGLTWQAVQEAMGTGSVLTLQTATENRNVLFRLQVRGFGA